MATLREILLTDEKQPLVFKDCESLLDDEVERKKGVSGLAVKTAFKMVKTFRKGFLPAVVAGLVPEFCDALEPLHQRHLKEDKLSFGQMMVANDQEVCRALLTVTDAKAEQSDNRTVRKLYAKMRDSAERNVLEAVPGLARLMDKHYGS